LWVPRREQNTGETSGVVLGTLLRRVGNATATLRGFGYWWEDGWGAHSRLLSRRARAWRELRAWYATGVTTRWGGSGGGDGVAEPAEPRKTPRTRSGAAARRDLGPSTYMLAT